MKDNKKEIDTRKEKIKELLTRKCENVNAIMVKLGNGEKKVVTEVEYEIMCLNALLQPNGREKVWYSDDYNNGPFTEIKEFSFRPSTRIDKPSFFDRRRIKNKEREINGIRESKDKFYDTPGIARIKIFPVDYREHEFYLSKERRMDR